MSPSVPVNNIQSNFAENDLERLAYTFKLDIFIIIILRKLRYKSIIWVFFGLKPLPLTSHLLTAGYWVIIMYFWF